MATLTVRIRMDNEAFSDGNREAETGRILAGLSGRLTGEGGYLALAQGVTGRLMDINGNTVGDYAVKGR